MFKKQRINMESSEFRSLGEYILVKPEQLEKEQKAKSGIILALDKDPTERPTFGVVQHLGEEVENIKVGQSVLWANTDGLDLEFFDGHRILLRKESILGFKQ